MVSEEGNVGIAETESETAKRQSQIGFSVVESEIEPNQTRVSQICTTAEWENSRNSENETFPDISIDLG